MQAERDALALAAAASRQAAAAAAAQTAAGSRQGVNDSPPHATPPPAARPPLPPGVQAQGALSVQLMIVGGLAWPLASFGWLSVRMAFVVHKPAAGVPALPCSSKSCMQFLTCTTYGIALLVHLPGCAQHLWA